MFRFAQVTFGSFALNVLWSVGLFGVNGDLLQSHELIETDAGPGISPDG